MHTRRPRPRPVPSASDAPHRALHRASHHALRRAAPSALALAAMLALAAPAAAQVTRHWGFVSGCGGADWLGMVSGANGQGQITCWTPTPGGFTGFAPPTALDDTFIALPTATTELLVRFADPSRAAFTGTARNLRMYGGAGFAVGLNMERHTLVTTNIELGLGGTNFIGRMAHSGGSVSATSFLSVLGGRYDQSGGSLFASGMQITSHGATAAYNQSGGTRNTPVVTLGSLLGQASTLAQTGGTATGVSIEIGSIDSTGVSTARISGGATRYEMSGSALVGSSGVGRMEVLEGGFVSNVNANIGLVPGSDGMVTVSDAASRWQVGGTLTVGNIGAQGRLALANGGNVGTGTLLLNNAPAQAGGAQGYAADVAGAGSVLGSSGATVVGHVTDGRLRVRDGGTASARSASVGENANTWGIVDLDGGTWNVSEQLVVAQRGTGQVDIRANGALNTGSAVIGAQQNTVGFVRLLHGSARWNTGALRVGNLGQGEISFAAGAGLNSGATWLGEGLGGIGTMTLDGGNRWAASGAVVVGLLGTGRVEASAGSVISSAGLTVAGGPAAQGEVVLRGAGTLWDAGSAQSLLIGQVGQGAVLVEQGAELRGSASTVGVNGQGRLRLADGAAQVGSMALGASLGSSGVVEVAKPGGRLAVTSGLIVGSAGSGELLVDVGGRVGASQLTVGSLGSGNGRVTVRGNSSEAPSRIDLSGDAVIGGVLAGNAGTGRLSVLEHGLLQVAGTTRTGVNGVVTLDRGSIVTGSSELGVPGRFDWRAGLLRITGTGGAALDDFSLPRELMLSAGRELRVDSRLAMGESSLLRLAGGTLAAGTLAFDNAMVLSAGSAHALDLSEVGTMQARGLVGVRVAGGGSANRLVATGSLTLGRTDRSDGYAYGGWLDAGAQQVVLLDRDQAELGRATTLADGGQLVTVNGARLDAGEELRSNGRASVQGRFVNNGFTAAETGELSFFDDVSGAGAFAGNLRFLAGFNPGNSVAQVSFGGGDVSFGPASRLTMEFDATGHDRLVDIGRFSFAGLLTLQFDAGFVPVVGRALSLFDFDSFDGALDASRITVAGYRSDWLDTSRLALDGTITVTAVPEPGTWAMLLGGLAGVGWMARRRKASSKAA